MHPLDSYSSFTFRHKPLHYSDVINILGKHAVSKYHFLNDNNHTMNNNMLTDTDRRQNNPFSDKFYNTFLL